MFLCGKMSVKFQSDNQNFFELACIQSATLGLAGIILGSNLAKQYGKGTAICSIIVANLVLWIIAVGFISISGQSRNTAIDNIKNFFGRFGGTVASLIFIIAFLGWYAAELNFSMETINQQLHIEEASKLDLVLRLGAGLGLVCALLSSGGIRMLKKISIFALPLLLIYHFYGMALSPSLTFPEEPLNLSFSAVLEGVLTFLPGIINFPTFFRHSKSKAHSFLALALFTLFATFFEVTTIFIDFTTIISSSYAVLTSIFIALTLLTCNMYNIYLASACWGLLVLHFESPKGYAIIGLLGTLTYTFIQISSPVQFILDITNAYIACLGLMLLLAYLTRIIIRHRPRTYEMLSNLSCWLFGCTLATIYEIHHYLKGMDALLYGLSATLLFYATMVFVEEIAWAIKTKRSEKLLKAK